MNALKLSNPKEEFALWLAQNQPRVFQALLVSARKRAHLSGITDWLTNVGTSVGGAVKSVGSFLTSGEGMATVSALGTVYLQTRTQRDALRLQLQQAQAGYSPQPVYTVGAGDTGVPYYRDPVTGHSYPLTSQLANQLKPSTSSTLTGIVVGAVLLTLFLFLKRSNP